MQPVKTTTKRMNERLKKLNVLLNLYSTLEELFTNFYIYCKESKNRSALRSFIKEKKIKKNTNKS